MPLLKSYKHADDEFVEISVKDNGIGIEDSNLAMIFDRFKQVDKSLSRNTEGTDVGLSLVKTIVELHGGSIHAESEYGKGSKFTVMLPSGKALKENMIYKSKVESKHQSIRVEISVYICNSFIKNIANYIQNTTLLYY
ncbi:hypothetical protein K9O30_22190 [Clostridium bowmanii]|uniref:sensor histidine kinase n=1 Tax=Clostridium bowmanii TaxID=132925 RepID=UPI001C0AA0A4|nr:ATP-binding protein [Clostridium bowmanii]MBU3192320.1 hypothetical protein [Clostridium bowmanii]MCA1076378.1 hypothetical protein [Clostridium bowmanii]